MRMLVSHNGPEINSLISNPVFKPYIGILCIPRYIIYRKDVYLCADNDAFKDFNETRYITMLTQLCHYNLNWVTCPDKVGNAKETLKLFSKWFPIISSFKIPIAYVAQNGIDEVPWNLISCLFIGGTTDFKYSKSVKDLILEAKKQNKLVHMGRVNTFERIKYSYELGCDSFDGSGAARFPKNIKKLFYYMIGLL